MGVFESKCGSVHTPSKVSLCLARISFGDNSKGMKLFLVYITAPKMNVAREIARVCVREKLAACTNIVPGVHSIFEWEGKTENAKEVILVMKTTQNRLGPHLISLQPGSTRTHPT